MKMLMIVCESGIEQEVLDILLEEKVEGYTKFSGVSGMGKTGRRDDTVLWPGQNTALLVGLPDQQAEAVVAKLERLLKQHGEGRVGLKMFSLETEELI